MDHRGGLTALLEPVAFAIHLQDVCVVCSLSDPNASVRSPNVRLVVTRIEPLSYL